MAFKMKGDPLKRNFGLPGINNKSEGNTDLPDGRSASSAFQKKDPKLTKKKIVQAADVELKEGGIMPTESMEIDWDDERVKVYKKGGKKFVKDDETGEFKQIKTKKLKKEGTLIGKRKAKKTKGLYGPELREALKTKKQKRKEKREDNKKTKAYDKYSQLNPRNPERD